MANNNGPDWDKIRNDKQAVIRHGQAFNLAFDVWIAKGLNPLDKGNEAKFREDVHKIFDIKLLSEQEVLGGQQEAPTQPAAMDPAVLAQVQAKAKEIGARKAQVQQPVTELVL